MTTKIVGIAGSLRRGSYNRMLLQAAAQMFPPDTEITTWDMLDRVPPFNEDWEADPAPIAVADLRQAIADADGLLIATPEYNGSIPGQLKNAMDWTSRPYGESALHDKPTVVISASATPHGAASAAADLRRVLTRARASVVDAWLSVPRVFAQFRPDGQLADPEFERQLRSVTAELAQAASRRDQAA